MANALTLGLDVRSTSRSSSINNVVLPSTVVVDAEASDYNEGLIPASSSPSLKSEEMHGMYPSNVQHSLTDDEEQVEFEDESIDKYIKEAEDDMSELSEMIDPIKPHLKETQPLLAVNTDIEGTTPPAMPSMELMKTGVINMFNAFSPKAIAVNKKSEADGGSVAKRTKARRSKTSSSY